MASKRTPNMRLKKAKKPTGVGREQKAKLFRMRTGTPNQMGDVRVFFTDGLLRRSAIEFLNSHYEWCRRFNHAGITRIEEACAAVEAMRDLDWQPGMPYPEVRCPVDDYSGLVLVVQMWKVPNG